MGILGEFKMYSIVLTAQGQFAHLSYVDFLNLAVLHFNIFLNNVGIVAYLCFLAQLRFFFIEI